MSNVGVNVFADLTGEGSLSETARTSVGALRRRGVPFSYNELLFPYAMYRDGVGLDADYGVTQTGMIYPANLLCYNLHLFPTFPNERLAEIRAGRYTMALWVWEMPDLPDYWHNEFDKLDEVWTPSKFVADSFVKATTKPVTVVPHPIELLPQTQGRAAFDLPEDRTVFLFTFSAGSGDGRKNPWGVLEAYRRAFGNSQAADRPVLLIKEQHAAYFPVVTTALAAKCEEVGARLITETYSRQKMHDLYYNIDCFVSLHHAEAFGLAMAEAMAAGKPLIATAYSGALEFMTPQNSFWVDYKLREVVAEDHRYRPEMVDHFRPGMIWAEGDIDQAAEYMVSVVENPEAARAVGARAAQDIRANFNYDVIGAIMEQRVRRACLGA
ncbi:MAG: glycosyltransferase family 4 protein [Chloroflexi bacterium]|uniref:glycosyltransferase family 4 protein n=1 Tax=Candidatus Flexifilum breve TaxID=3140694 RepID=UPI003135CE39|nr:glycosyltransferase family 4 protein [Chloroflexota bacterium]